MDGVFETDTASKLNSLRPAADRILQIQTADGAIPWFEDGAWDPWNHTESAMALCVFGEFEAAAKAFDHLARTQRSDGAWVGEYGNALPMVDRDYISREKAPSFLDSNFCAYPALGVVHYLKVTRDIERVRAWWPTVKRALDFVLTLQREDGSFSWSQEAVGTDDDDALLAGNASIAKSLECGIYLARALDQPSDVWQAARRALSEALRNKPDVFDRGGKGARFAMDWYYPVLAGYMPLDHAQSRMDAVWQTFVIPERGCRCVSDEPWVTIAETAELILALLCIGDRTRAKNLFEQIEAYRDHDGAFWMGWQSEEKIYWPRERPSWTQAAVILAADALHGETAGSQVLTTSLL